MGANTKIEWCDFTFNPWRGCTKIAAGCANCYADSQAKRNPKTLGIWGDQGTRVVASETMWREPVKWNKAAEQAGVRQRVFCASMADVFEDWQGQLKNHYGDWAVHNRKWGKETDFSWVKLRGGSDALHLDGVRRRLFRLIDATPHLDWLLLTKRPENIPAMWPAFFPGGYIAEAGSMNQEGPRPNVWLGCSIANQADADRNIPLLLQCRELAPVLFVSAEPLLGPVDLDLDRYESPGFYEYRKNLIDWLICGGESGPNARPMHPDWARSLRDQCQAAGVPFFFKQWGEWRTADQGQPVDPMAKIAAIHPNGTIYCSGKEKLPLGQDVAVVHRVGKKAAGRLLDGREWSEFPKVSV